MNINELLKERNMPKYQLAQKAGELSIICVNRNKRCHETRRKYCRISQFTLRFLRYFLPLKEPIVSDLITPKTKSKVILSARFQDIDVSRIFENSVAGLCGCFV